MRKKKQTNKQASTLAQILHSLFLKISPGYYSRRKKNWRHCLRSRNFVWGGEGRGQSSTFIMKHVKMIKGALQGCASRRYQRHFHSTCSFLTFFFPLCAHFGLESGMIFEGTTGLYECIYGFNSKWVRTNSKWILRNCFCFDRSNGDIIS